MDRRAAGALLALAACFACSAAAPTASNHTALDLYEGAPEGCYYNFQHYGEGDRIMTNEPCLNCTCHNRMLMCYLRVCPFTKAIGQDCTVEKRADQCCPIVTCPDVPVDLLTSTSTTSPAEYGATGLGKLDKYGCSISGKYFPEGSKVPPTPNKPCEHCYCIRNMTTCVMQECTLHVDGCTPIYHKDVCCPVRYSCDHPEDELPLLDDMSTTVRPTPGFLLTTTTMSPVTQMTQDCVHDDQVFSDGALIKTEKACEHCYCMKGDIVCVVQECGAPMENEGKNCTSLPPREGQCCPDTYICEGDELSSELPTEATTESIIDKLTTLSPPRRTSVEGSGYRIEPDEASYTEMPIMEPEVEGSGEEEETQKPIGSDDILPTPGDDEQFISAITKRPAHEEQEKTTAAVDEVIIPDMKDKTDEPHVSSTSAPISEEVEKPTTSGIVEKEISEPQTDVPTTKTPVIYDSATTELGDLQNTVPDVIPDEEIVKPHDYATSSTYAPPSESYHIEGEDDKLTTSQKEKEVIKATTSKPEYGTTSSSSLDDIGKETATPTDISSVIPEVITEKEYSDGDITRTTSATSDKEDKETSKPDLLSISTTISPTVEEKETSKPDLLAPDTTVSSVDENQETSKPDLRVPDATISPDQEDKETSKPDLMAPDTSISPAEEDKETSKPDLRVPDATISPDQEDKETSKPDLMAPDTSISPAVEDKETSEADLKAPDTTISPAVEDKETSKPDLIAPDSSISPDHEDKETTKPDLIAPDATISPDQEDKETSKPDLIAPDATISPDQEDKETSKPDLISPDSTISPAEEDKETSKPDLIAPDSSVSPDQEDKETTKPDLIAPDATISPDQEDKETSKPDLIAPDATISPDQEDKETPKPDLISPDSTISPAEEDKETSKPDLLAPGTTISPAEEEKESTKPEQPTVITTSTPLVEEEKLTTEPDHAQNTVGVAEEDSKYPHSHIPTSSASPTVDEESTTAFNLEPELVTEKVTKDVTSPTELGTTAAPAEKETKFTTAEPDRGLNTIPSEIYEETSSEPSAAGTESSFITDEQHTQGADIKPTIVSELTTPLPESIVTKGDQFTVTTEPSFRKEDEVIVSSEKPKEIEPTTVKSEFVDEGLIPTSSHDDKISTSSDVPTTEDEFTTSVPEYITEIVETIEPKQTTTESTKETPVVTDIAPEKVPDHDTDLPSSTEKLAEITPLVETEHEEPSRIPGEGDCLLNGITYRNNTVVPSTNNCHTGCRCASSIIKCDPIICSPPPDYMDNCQSIYDSPDSCCPTFVCDHPRETVPPQSDNQMSGTESPMPSPTIECRGDQCEITEPTKQPSRPSEPCTSGSCLPGYDHQTEKECGSDGCGDVAQKPDTMEQECSDGKCKPETQVSPVTPCEGEHCEKTSEVVPGVPQQCKDGEDCKTLEIPNVDATLCEGDSCNKVDCGDGGCGPDVITAAPDHQQESCKEEDGCKPEDIPIPECTGDEPCRRKEISDSDAKPPTACEGPNCISDKTITEPTPADETGKTTPAEGETATEIPDDHISKPVDENIPVKDSQEMDTHTTEKQTAGVVTSADVGKEKPVIEDDATKKPMVDEDKDIDMSTPIDEEHKEKPIPEGEITEKPTMIEKDVTKSPDVIDEETDKPVTTGKEGEEKPTVDEEKSTEEPVTVEDNITEGPTLPGDDVKEKPAESEDETTESPVLDVREGTENPAIGDVDIKEKPLVDEQSTKKPDLVEGEGTTKPLTTEEDTDKPAITEDGTPKPEITEDGTDKPAISEDGTDKPAVIEDGTDKPTITEDGTDKPAITEDGTDKPAITEHGSDKPPVTEDGTDKPAITEVGTDQPAVTEDGADKPVITEDGEDKPAIIEDGTDKPAVTEDGTDKPAITEVGTDKPAITEDGTDKPAVTEDGTDKPAITEVGTDKPAITEDGTDKPVITEDGEDKPAITEDGTDKPVITEDGEDKPAVTEDGTDKPAITEVGTDKPAITEDGTDKPVITEDGDDKPAIIEDGTDKPAITEDGTDKPLISEDGTDKPAISEDGTEKPFTTDEERKPTDGDEKETDKPDRESEGTDKPGVEEIVTKTPDVIRVETTIKPSDSEDEFTERPIHVEEKGTEPTLVTEDGEKESVVTEEVTQKPANIDEASTEKSVITDGELSVKPIAEEKDKIPIVIDNEGTEEPAVVDKDTGKPLVEQVDNITETAVLDQESTEKTVISDDTKPEKSPEIEEDHKDKPVVASTGKPGSLDEDKITEKSDIDEGTEEPTYVDKDAEKPTVVETESTKMPTDIDRQVTELSTSIGDETTKKPDMIEAEDVTKSDTEIDTMKPFTIKEESTAIPDITKEEGTAKPVIIDETTEEPTIIEKEDPMKTTVIEREGTELPAITGEQGTEKPDMADQQGTKKPAIIDEETSKPGVSDESTEEPSMFETEGTEKPVDKDDAEKPVTDKDQEKPEREKPLIIDEEIPDKPAGNEGLSTEKPVTHEEEGSGAEIPETPYTTEPEKEVESPKITVQPTEAAITEFDKITKIPYSESQTTLAEDDVHPYDDSSTPKTKVTDVEDVYSKEPVIHTTEPLSEQEITTKASVTDNDKESVSEQGVEATTFKMDTTEVKIEGSTVGQDVISEEPTLVTKSPELHGTSEPIEKTTETGSISDQEEVSTDTSDIESPTTKAPGTAPAIVEPQDGVETEKPEQKVTSKLEEDSTTKVYEGDKMKPVPESHVTETSDGATDVSDEHKPKPESPEQHDTEPYEQTTQVPVVEIKTDQPETHSSKKEETVTETSEYSVTEPIRRYTEIEDPSVTGQEEIVTGYPEHYVPSSTDKIDESGDDGKPTTEKPLLTDMEFELPEKSTESDKHVTKKPEQDYQTPESAKPTDDFETPAPEIPISVVTEPQQISDIPEKDVTKYEEKTTIVPDLSDHKLPEGYTEKQEPETATEEQIKATEPHLIEPNVTELQETSTKTVEDEIKDTQATTTDIPRISEKEGEAITTAPEQQTDLEKTGLPLDEVQTELPGVQPSSEIPQSLITQQQETLGEQTTISSVPKEESSHKPELQTTQSAEISEAPETHIPDQEETQTGVPPIHVTEPAEETTKEQEDKMTHVVPEEPVTEKQEPESPAVTEKIEQTDVMKSTEHTSAQTEVSETTPYLIELEEHTHKIEYLTTVSPSEEEHSYKPVEDTSKPSPSEDEHSYKPVEDISTPSPTEEEHSHKPVEDIPTPSPIEDEELHKPVEDIPTPSPTEEEQSHKPVEDIPTPSPADEEHSYKPMEDMSTLSPTKDDEDLHKPVVDIATSSPPAEEYTSKIEEHVSTVAAFDEKPTTVQPYAGEESTTKKTDEEIETVTKEAEGITKPSEESLPEDVSEKVSESIPVEETTPAVVQGEGDKDAADHTTSAPTQTTEESLPVVVTESEKVPTSELDIASPTEKEISTSEKPLHPIVSHETAAPEEEFIFSTTKATTVRQGEDIATPGPDSDKIAKPEEKPSETSEIPPSSTTTEVSKPSIPDLQPTDEIPAPVDDGHFAPSGTSGYGEPDYVDEDQAFGPGTCRYGGKVYVSAQQIPRDDPCDFCFCFRSDIICLQQSCPPPIHGCHEEPIQGFCCPRYECPVSMATTVNVTTTTTTTTTTLPPHFPTHSYKGAVQRRGCQIKGHTYKVGEVVRSSSGPCLHCTCGGDGQMKCDPKACTPEPMLRQMIAAAVSAKRRR